eukprot:2677627-Rhodomonas_salina.2
MVGPLPRDRGCQLGARDETIMIVASVNKTSTLHVSLSGGKQRAGTGCSALELVRVIPSAISSLSRMSPWPYPLGPGGVPSSLQSYYMSKSTSFDVKP